MYPRSTSEDKNVNPSYMHKLFEYASGSAYTADLHPCLRMYSMGTSDGIRYSVDSRTWYLYMSSLLHMGTATACPTHTGDWSMKLAFNSAPKKRKKERGENFCVTVGKVMTLPKTTLVFDTFF